MPEHVYVFVFCKNLENFKSISQMLDTITDVSVIGNASSHENFRAISEVFVADLILLDMAIAEEAGQKWLADIARIPSRIVINNCYEKDGKISYPDAEKLGIVHFLPEIGEKSRNFKSIRVQLLTIVGSVKSKKYFNLGKEKELENPSPVEKKPVVNNIEKVEGKEYTDRFKVSQILKVKVVAIASSTGGPKALEKVIPKLPKKLGVPVLLVQHMPPHSTDFLCSSLNKISSINVKVGTQDEEVLPDNVYLAPGGQHMFVRKKNNETGDGKIYIGLNDDPPENSVRPAADVLFRSVAEVYGGNILAIIMTGMGKDGLIGVKHMKDAGCICLTQSRETCVVYGMSRSVDDAGLSDGQVDLDDLADKIIHFVRNRNIIKQ